MAFAPNTHEFVARLYSCLDWSKPVRVLSSAHEFYSFRRQTRRLQETGRVELTEISAEPWETFEARFSEAASSGEWDLIFLSQVFFDSGFVVRDLERIVHSAPAKALVAIDGYHAFCAIPVDFSALADRAFYLAGGYKYAMAGEGACFLAVPPGCDLRPAHTGWYASFETLSAAPGAEVPYAEDAFRFWGATFDPSGLYRFDAVMRWLQEQGASIERIHNHVLALQERFLDALAKADLAALPATSLVPPRSLQRGNFLAFEVDGAEFVHQRLDSTGIYIDRRDRRLRFGFGVYHEAGDIDRLVEVMACALG